MRRVLRMERVLMTTTGELPRVDASVLASYEPYGAHIPDGDRIPTDTLVVKTATPERGGWTVRSEQSWCCFVPRTRADAPVPAPGDTLVTYGGIGRTIEGMTLAKPGGVPVVLWYRSAAQRDEHRRRELANIRASRERDFERHRHERDQQVAGLPEPFWRRIERFRSEDPEFRVESEGYELFVLVEAAKLARALETAEAIEAFGDMTYAQQVAAVPDIANDQHSGWTHGCMIRFALALVRGDDV